MKSQFYKQIWKSCIIGKNIFTFHYAYECRMNSSLGNHCFSSNCCENFLLLCTYNFWKKMIICSAIYQILFKQHIIKFLSFCYVLFKQQLNNYNLFWLTQKRWHAKRWKGPWQISFPEFWCRQLMILEPLDRSSQSKILLGYALSIETIFIR